jgi:metallothiol transferase
LRAARESRIRLATYPKYTIPYMPAADDPATVALGRSRRAALRIKGFSHVAIRVSDLARSARFYEDLLEMRRIIDLPEVVVLLHESGAMLGVRGRTREQRDDDTFDAFRVGLDHLALSVDRAQLPELKAELDRRRVRNNGIETDPVTGADHITFYDPDGIAWELYAL